MNGIHLARCNNATIKYNSANNNTQNGIFLYLDPPYFKVAKKGNLYGKVIEYTRTENGTSIGRRPKTSSMNKSKRRSFKKYRGQGK